VAKEQRVKLINKKHVKELALKLEQSRFPDYPKIARQRVSNSFLEACEAHLEAFIRTTIYTRSNGAGPKTI